MTEMTTSVADAQPRQWFYVNSYATGWWWYPLGLGYLYCFDGLLRFELLGPPLIGRFFRTTVFEHRNPRIVLASPSMPFPNFYTIIVFEQGKISVSIPGNRDLIRTTLEACGFQVVETPPRRSWPRDHREIWQQYGEQPK